MMKVLIIDNYDSFTYNLVHLVEKVAGERPTVLRNDSNGLGSLDAWSHLILSPGPGVPAEAGRLTEVIRRYAAEKAILGVCLGHQALGEAFGARLRNLNQVYHGVSDTMRITRLDEPLYAGMQDLFTAARYHSWVVDNRNLPDDLVVNCVDAQGEIMGLSHRHYRLKGVQFHPESHLSAFGEKIIHNFLKL